MSDFIKDKAFDIQNSKDYILSIQVSLDGFSFLMVEPEEKRIVAYKNSDILISSLNLLSRHLKEWLDAKEILKNKFNKVRIVYFTEKFALIPEKLFPKEKNRIITSTLFEKKIHNHFQENKIESHDATIIFPVINDVKSVLHNFFDKKIEIVHPLTQLLESDFDSTQKIQSILLPTDKFFYLLVRRNNKTLSANSFPVEHKNDIVYNVVNTFQQLGLARNETEISIVGTNTQNLEIGSILKPYFIYISKFKAEGIISNPDIIYNSFPLYLTIN